MSQGEAPVRSGAYMASSAFISKYIHVQEPVVSIEGDGATVAFSFEDGLHCRFQ